MFKAEIQFANLTESMAFADKVAASNYANDLLEMFKGEEKWFDNERKTYIVTAHHLEIA